VHSHISASKLNRLNMRELRAYGANGSYVVASTDVQAQAIFAGKRPVNDLKSWGYDAEEHWGTLRTADGAVSVPSEQGRYQAYYEAFAEAIRTGGKPPVTAEEGIAVLSVLDAARISAAQGRVVAIE
jgi:predicted dehydrogenase